MDKITEEVNYFLNNDITVEECASHFGISKRTFQLHLDKFSKISDENLKLVKDKRQKNIDIGIKKGGTIGKRKSSYSESDVEELLKEMIAKDMSFSELSSNKSIPKSTLHLISKIISDPELKKDFGTMKEAHIVNKEISSDLKNKYSK